MTHKKLELMLEEIMCIEWSSNISEREEDFFKYLENVDEKTAIEYIGKYNQLNYIREKVYLRDF